MRCYRTYPYPSRRRFSGLHPIPKTIPLRKSSFDKKLYFPLKTMAWSTWQVKENQKIHVGWALAKTQLGFEMLPLAPNKQLFYLIVSTTHNSCWGQQNNQIQYDHNNQQWLRVSISINRSSHKINNVQLRNIPSGWHLSPVYVAWSE